MDDRARSAVTSLALFALALITLLFSPGVRAQGPDDSARDVEVRMFIIDLENINDASQNFTANLAMMMRWHDPDLAHTGPEPISVHLDDIWSPNIQILNQQKLVSPFPRLAEIHPDGEVIYRQKYWGAFSQPLRLRNFPFDSQQLQITLANVGFAAEKVNLISSPESGISENFSLSDWDVTGWQYQAVDLPFDDGSYRIGGMNFSLDVERDTSFFWYKVLLPLFLIVVMSWLVFWIDPSLVGSQISVSVTAMLTMIAYRFALAGLLPRLNFLTTLDYFVLVSTMAVFVSMIEVVYTAYLSTNERLDQARAIDRRARWVVPSIYIPLALWTLSYGVWW